MSKKDKDVDITSLDFFKDELALFDENIHLNDELYGEVHDIFERQKGASGSVFANTRDMAEMGKTLSGIRSTSIEAINKKISAKIQISKIKLQKDARNSDDEALNRTSEIMKELSASLQNQNSGKESQAKRYEMVKGSDVEPIVNGQDLLDQRVENELNSGGITINSNESAMKHDFAGISYAYDTTENTVKAIDKNGGVIKDYPEERIPRDLFSVTQVQDGKAITEGGAEIPVIED